MDLSITVSFKLKEPSLRFEGSNGLARLDAWLPCGNRLRGDLSSIEDVFRDIFESGLQSIPPAPCLGIASEAKTPVRMRPLSI